MSQRSDKPSKSNHPVPRLHMLLIGLFGTVGVACEANGPQLKQDSIRYDQWDSAGVRITVSSANALDVALPWRSDTVPDLELGRIDAKGPYQFYRIRGIIGVAGGGLTVVDAGSRELRWFDGSGRHLLRIGGEGDGPGEFRDPLLVPQFRGDSLLVFDARARRFTWVALDGSGYRQQGPPEGGTRLVAGAASGARGSRVLFRTGFGECVDPNFCEGSLYVRWVDPILGVADTIAEFPRRTSTINNVDGLPFGVRGPFDPVAAVAMGPKGPVVGGGPPYVLRQFDEAGRLTDILRVDAPLRATTSEAFDKVVQQNVERGLNVDAVRDKFERMGIPAALPAFQSLVVDQIGWHWAELYRLDQADPSIWLVFDADGRAQGVIELPADLEVHDIGESYILGRWVDDLGVEYVRRYGLNRAGD